MLNVVYKVQPYRNLNASDVHNPNALANRNGIRQNMLVMLFLSVFDYFESTSVYLQYKHKM